MEGAGLYTASQVPTRTILPLSDQEIDQTTRYGYIQLAQDQVFEEHGIRAVYPANTVLPAADQFILTIIKQTWGDRPVYFAATTNAHRKLGLAPYTVRRGVAFKLVSPDSLPEAGLVKMPEQSEDPMSAVYGAYVNVPVNRVLLDSIFMYRGLVDKAHWTDDATRGIPTYYGYAYLALSRALEVAGDTAAAQTTIRKVEDWMKLSER